MKHGPDDLEDLASDCGHLDQVEVWALSGTSTEEPSPEERKSGPHRAKCQGIPGALLSLEVLRAWTGGQ